jgi:subtilase family serine protease
MTRHRISVLTIAFLACGALHAQPSNRINQRIDNARTVRLAGGVHPATRAARDLGRAAAELPMERMMMQLTSSPEQQAALEDLLAGQHDPASPDFHRWLTPEEFGERFGPSQSEIDAVTQWLESQSFTVHNVARGRRVIEFSGSARQVERAFHTEIRRYSLAGEEHIANAIEISLPEALAPVVAGLASLHNFPHKPMHRVIAPLTALNGGSQGLSPWDFAAIYNVLPLWNSSFDGTGQSVAIAGRSNIQPADAQTFRSTFGLPANNPQVILNGADPGIWSAGEQMEANLDVQWSGGVAKGATVKFVVSKSTNASDGVDLSNQYIVTNNVAPAMSVSFGACEAAIGAGGNSFYNSLWQQAAAQGISVFVSSGDSGAAGCDASSASSATHGLGINGLGSSPYNTAVGGTEFADNSNPSAYWKPTNDSHNASAIGYIPETTWNESGGGSIFAGGGGVSLVYPTPTWQTGAGVPAADPGASGQHHRYVPDVSLTAASHDGYLVVQNGGLYIVGGTSASSHSFAGLAAILAQYTGGRNGNLNTRFYSLAAQTPAAFHDVTTGTNAVPCPDGSPNCASGVTTGFAAGAGYDLATGLGSVDAYAMALNWASHAPSAPSIASMSPNPMPAGAIAQTLTITGTNFVSGATVTASYTGGTPVTLTTSSVSATSITASFTPGTTARTWSVVVTNPGGAASSAASLQVTAPAPSIASMSPNPMPTSARRRSPSLARTS